jgi:peptidyl-prolyl cis-trans isomerase B (cyclophilin B)
MLKTLTSIALCLIALVITASAQDKKPVKKVETAAPQTLKKSNRRPAVKPPTKAPISEPFEKATVETMAAQCVQFDTEAGIVELEMFPESAPETVRSFLNLTATGAFNTTTFSRIVPGFIVQGGNLGTHEKFTAELAARANRPVPDEPNLIKHERGIISMARSNAPNSATTNFFILVGAAPHLDKTFAAFGRVIRGMEVVDAINKMPVEAEKPTKPIHIKRATVAACPAQPKP